MEEKNKFLRGIIARTGFKQTGIPYERPARYAGETKAGFCTAFNVAINGIFSFSYFPLHIATILGFVISIASFITIFIELGLCHDNNIDALLIRHALLLTWNN